MIKKIVFTFIFYCIAATTVAQYCSCISVIKKSNGIETKSGTVKSNDGYNLLFQKEINPNDLSTEPVYFLSLEGTSRTAFSNSLIKDKGEIELFLKDKTKMLLEKARCFYNPISSGFGVIFGATITKEQLEIILVNPIVTFNAFDIFKTSFKEKRQMEQQIIVSCLLNDK